MPSTTTGRTKSHGTRGHDTPELRFLLRFEVHRHPHTFNVIAEPVRIVDEGDGIPRIRNLHTRGQADTPPVTLSSPQAPPRIFRTPTPGQLDTASPRSWTSTAWAKCTSCSSGSRAR